MRYLLLAVCAAHLCPIAMAEPTKLVIAHRGASGDAPEHSLRAYELALAQQADVLELDLVVSRDQQLLIRHENELSLSTDVANRPEFASRKTEKMIDGLVVTGWFSEDFTLAELQSLRLKESKPTIRPNNTKLDYVFPLLSLQDFLYWNQQQWQQGKRFDLYMELKHPTYFQYQAPKFEADIAFLLKAQLEKHPLPRQQRLYLQSFEIAPLQRWSTWRDTLPFPITIVQLLGDVSGGSQLPKDNFAYPWDQVYAMQQQARRTVAELLPQLPRYQTMVSTDGLAAIASYADAIGPWRENLYPYAHGPVVPWLAEAKKLGLKIHPYTYRAEVEFQPLLPSGQRQTLCQELHWILQQSWIDGVFTDHPAIAIQARQGKCQP